MPIGATIGAAVVGGAASLGAAAMQSNSAAAALAYQKATYAPFVSAGQGAITSLANMYGLNGANGGTTDFSKFTSSPDYQFAFNQGLGALDASAASKGMLLSGAQVKDAQTFGQGLASQQFGNYVNRLLSLSQIGASAGTSAGAQVGATTQSLGAAQASGLVGASNSLTGGLNNYAQYKMYTSPSSYSVAGSGGLY